MSSACKSGPGIPVVHGSASQAELGSSKPWRNPVSKNKEPMLRTHTHHKSKASSPLMNKAQAHLFISQNLPTALSPLPNSFLSSSQLPHLPTDPQLLLSKPKASFEAVPIQATGLEAEWITPEPAPDWEDPSCFLEASELTRASWHLPRHQLQK